MSIPLFHLAPDLTVSRLCFGTMTFGEQNSLPQSFRLLDEAFEAGINFVDSAEMYPVPQRRATQGRSEKYLGRWMRERKIPRDRVVVATKVTGPSGQMTWIRGGPKSLDANNILEAIDNRISLLAYSPMAMGILSGKYFSPSGGPSDARMNLFRGRYSEGESRYNLSNPILKSAVQEYVDIAVKYGLSPACLAIDKRGETLLSFSPCKWILRKNKYNDEEYDNTNSERVAELLSWCLLVSLLLAGFLSWIRRMVAIVLLSRVYMQQRVTVADQGVHEG